MINRNCVGFILEVRPCEKPLQRHVILSMDMCFSTSMQALILGPAYEARYHLYGYLTNQSIKCVIVGSFVESMICEDSMLKMISFAMF